jgi:hypothetical protein
MAFILNSTPPTLKLFLTCEIQEEVLSAIKRDSELGAHEAYGACARLEIDQRDDLRNLKSPEEVLRKLQGDGTLPNDDGFQPFLLADETTARDGVKATLWMVENWAQAEDFDDDALVPGAKGDMKKGRLPFAEKLRIFAY